MGLADRVAGLEGRVARLENRFTALEDVIAQHLDTFGAYKTRTSDELSEIQAELRPIIGALEALVATAENRSDSERAARLLRRARNNMTRAQKAAASLSA